YTFTRHLTTFFFQAEDGIRDRNVTGVQTCALPICGLLPEDAGMCRGSRVSNARGSNGCPVRCAQMACCPGGCAGKRPGAFGGGEIGRASWRERGEGGVAEG